MPRPQSVSVRVRPPAPCRRFDASAPELTPDVLLAGGNLTSYTGMLEWLVSESTPISLFGSYTNTQVSGGGGHLNLWMIGVKFYTDGNGTTLVGKHRNGALDNIVRPSIRILN